MITEIIEDWLQRFNRKMKREKRNILLFLDNELHMKFTPATYEFFKDETSVFTNKFNGHQAIIGPKHYPKL